VLVPTLKVYIHKTPQPAVQSPNQPHIKRLNPQMAGKNPLKNPWLAARLKPLVLSPTNQLGDLPEGYWKVLPKLNGDTGITI